MKIIALTGGIGSGKSVVRKILEVLGYPTISSDQVAKNLYLLPVIKSKIIDLIGEKAYTPEGLNKDIVRNFIFSKSENLQAINQLIHPHVAVKTDEWFKKQNHSVIFKESALIFESRLENKFDSIINVTCPEEIRHKRLIKKGLTEKQIELIKKTQFSQKEKSSRSDFIIVNDEKKSLIQQVTSLIQKISS